MIVREVQNSKNEIWGGKNRAPIDSDDLCEYGYDVPGNEPVKRIRKISREYLFWCFCAGNDSPNWHKMSAYGAI